MLQIDITWIATIISLTIGGITIYNAWKNRPQRKRMDDLENRMKTAEEKLANDYREVKEIKQMIAMFNMFMRVSLQAQKGILSHLAKGDETNEIKTLEQAIDKFLIEKEL